MTIIGEVVYKKSMIFEVSGAHLSKIVPHEIFLGSKNLPSFCDKHQKYDYGWFSYPGWGAQSPYFGRFLTKLDVFWAVWFGISLLSRTLITNEKSV